MKIRKIESVDSTNSYLKANPGAVGELTMLAAYEQTAGRGQRGNHWEAEPGKNLTFSFYFKPEGVRPREQFAISEAVALGITDYLSGEIEAKVKWPNDIYAGDEKIAGILIEHSIMGMEITRSIVGVGLNINQREFRSDAPNPTSLALLTGKNFDIDAEAEKLGKHLEKRLAMTRDEQGRERLHTDYLKHLWRHDGRNYRFVDTRIGEEFEGKIVCVEPEGLLAVKKESGRTDRFAFKEISFII